jgi:N-carbamoylputrescine amidase
MGADFLVYPTAIGWALHQDEETNADQYHAWQSVMKGHSVANGIPVVAVNRTGVEGEMQFWGGSFVTNAFGKVMFQAPHLDASLTVQQIDLTETDYYRTHWPFLRDRRIDAYEPILNRFID